MSKQTADFITRLFKLTQKDPYATTASAIKTQAKIINNLTHWIRVEKAGKKIKGQPQKFSL